MSEWLFSGQNPIVLLTRGRVIGNGLQTNRAVGFCLGPPRQGSKKRIIATCRHFFTKGPQAGTLLCHAGALELLEHEIVDGPFFPEAPGIDLAFLVVRPHRSTAPDKFTILTHEWSPSIGMRAYNVRNDVARPNTGRPAYIMQQEIGGIPDYVAYTHVEDDQSWIEKPDDALTREEYENRGYVRHLVLNMLSLAACSGSPVFTEDRRLVGMNLKGGTAPNGDDNLICLPGHRIQEEFERILPRLRARR